MIIRRGIVPGVVTVQGINHLSETDLVEVRKYTKYNKGYRYIMTVINCFTKFTFAKPYKIRHDLR